MTASAVTDRSQGVAVLGLGSMGHGIAASGAGMGHDDDASLARLYARLSGAVLPEPMSPPA